MDMAGAHLDHEEHVDAPQGNGAVDVEEIARQHRGSLRTQELAPGSAAALCCGRDPQPLQHAPYRRCPDPVPQAEQLTLNPLVPPARVLSCHLLDQHCDPGIDRRPAAAAGIGPPPADQPPVPAQEAYLA
jgi:hypothetical protein